MGKSWRWTVEFFLFCDWLSSFQSFFSQGQLGWVVGFIPWGLKRTWFSSWKSWKVKKDVPQYELYQGKHTKHLPWLSILKAQNETDSNFQIDLLFRSFLVAWFARKNRVCEWTPDICRFGSSKHLLIRMRRPTLIKQDHKSRACKRNRSKTVHESKREAKEVHVSIARNPFGAASCCFTPSYVLKSLNSLNFRDWMWMDLFKIYPNTGSSSTLPNFIPHNNGPTVVKTDHIRTRPKEVEVTRLAPNGFSDIHRREWSASRVPLTL